MSVLDKFYKKDQLIQKTVEIDGNLFDKIEFLSKNVYDAYISKLKNSLEELEKLKEKYEISITKLINISIHSVLKEKNLI